jgi:hypothetical protein
VKSPSLHRSFLNVKVTSPTVRLPMLILPNPNLN